MRTVETDGVLSVTMEGELDVTARQGFVELSEEVRRREPRLVEADLAAVTFIDSAGLAGLAHVATIAQEQGGRMHVSGVGERDLVMFELAGVLALLGLEDEDVNRAMGQDSSDQHPG